MAFSLLVNAASSRNRLALKTRIGILQELPGLIRARGNPAGRKSLHGKTSGLRGIPQAHLSVTGVPAPERSDG
jgi:hypothetical protein